MMNYDECIAFLFSSLPMYQRQGAPAYKNSLETTLLLDEAHDFPHRKFRSIHIAGTNGKGSVSHMLAAILQSAGYKTGLYTSPHLTDFRERIRINGEMIREESVTDYVNKNKNLISKLQPSFFEMTVDMAFQYFAEEEVDVAVIETGMGGRLDSTNIIRPELSIITNIGLDHTRFLGSSIEEIAGEKAGIIKRDIPVVIGETNKLSAPVFIKHASDKKCPLLFADNTYFYRFSTMTEGRKRIFHFEKADSNPVSFECALSGDYQSKNIACVLQAMDILQEKSFSVSLDDLEKGLANVRELTGIRGRWEETGHNPLTICDTAHNADGVREVVKQIRNTAFKKLHIVWGMVNDKDSKSILKLLPAEAQYYFTRASIPRALDENELKEFAIDAGLAGDSFSSVKKAYESAMQNAAKEDLVFIGGSTFVVADLLEFTRK